MREKGIKTVICTTPLRGAPADYPPFGAMAIIQALRSAGYDSHFLDIDAMRPSREEMRRFFKEYRPDVLGISGVVSTAYGFTKRLCSLVRSVSPSTRIVLGGNLAASAEICHRKAGIDFCVIGDGEVSAVNLWNYFNERRSKGLEGDDEQALRAIKGITFLGGAGKMLFTGYESNTMIGGVPDPDYTILEKYSRLDTFLVPPLTKPDFAYDPRSYEPKRRGMKRGIIRASRGCVARCTFCHRWEKGYRTFPVETIVRQIRYLKERYNVGSITFTDENFGTDKRHLGELITALKSLDILYMVGGVRCSTVDPELLRRLKESGCVSMNYGMETGSARILKVMEKKLSLKDNLNAALWTQAAKLYNIYQIVLAMPGENDETITETTEFFKKVTEDLPESPLIRFRVNYLQILPGTPVYEYARSQGHLGKTLDDEEAYLLHVSDTDAADDTKFVNLTDSDYWTVQSWRRRIILEVLANYHAKKNSPRPTLRDIYVHTVYRLLRPAAYEELRLKNSYQGGLDFSRKGYFNFIYALYYDIIIFYLYPVRIPLLWMWLLMREFRRLSLREFLGNAGETLRNKLSRRKSMSAENYRSVRKVVAALPSSPSDYSTESMAALRSGR